MLSQRPVQKADHKECLQFTHRKRVQWELLEGGLGEESSGIDNCCTKHATTRKSESPAKWNTWRKQFPTTSGATWQQVISNHLNFGSTVRIEKVAMKWPQLVFEAPQLWPNLILGAAMCHEPFHPKIHGRRELILREDALIIWCKRRLSKTTLNHVWHLNQPLSQHLLTSSCGLVAVIDSELNRVWAFRNNSTMTKVCCILWLFRFCSLVSCSADSEKEIIHESSLASLNAQSARAVPSSELEMTASERNDFRSSPFGPYCSKPRSNDSGSADEIYGHTTSLRSVCVFKNTRPSLVWKKEQWSCPLPQNYWLARLSLWPLSPQNLIVQTNRLRIVKR